MRRQEGTGVLARTRAFGIQLQIAAEMLDADINSSPVIESAHVMWQSLHGLVSLHTAKKLGFGMGADALVKPTIQAIVNGLFGKHIENHAFRRPQLPVVAGLISSPAKEAL